jgi:hypothetical protein
MAFLPATVLDLHLVRLVPNPIPKISHLARIATRVPSPIQIQQRFAETFRFQMAFRTFEEGLAQPDQHLLSPAVVAKRLVPNDLERFVVTPVFEGVLGCLESYECESAQHARISGEAESGSEPRF